MDKKLVTLNDYIEAGVMSKMAFNRYTLYDISIKDQNDMPLNINIPDMFNDCEVRYIAVDFYNKKNVAFYLSTKKFREKRNFTVVNFINFVHANKMIGSSFNTEEYVNVRYRATTVDDVLRDIYKKYNTDNILSGYKFYTVLMLEGHSWKCPLQQYIYGKIGEPELNSIQKKFVSDFAGNLFKELIIDSFKIYTNTELKSKCLYIYINFDKNKVAINKTIKTIRDMIYRTSETEEEV